jgi:hypothetical protein
MRRLQPIKHQKDGMRFHVSSLFSSGETSAIRNLNLFQHTEESSKECLPCALFCVTKVVGLKVNVAQNDGP